MYQIVMLKRAEKHLKLLKQKKAWISNTHEIIRILQIDPLQNPPPYEKLRNDMDGIFSRRINLQQD